LLLLNIMLSNILSIALGRSGADYPIAGWI
jgi:hypothetical protein